MKNKKLNAGLLLTGIMLFSASPMWAQATTEAPKNWYLSDTTFWILMAVAAILFYVIYALAEVVIWGGQKKINEIKNKSGNLKSLVVLAITLLATSDMMGQATAAVAQPASESFWKSDFLPLYILIGIEIGVIVYLSLMLMQLSKAEQVATGVKHETWIAKLWDKWNYKVPIEREEEMLIEDHDYDGIHELDNTMPPWLQYIFFFTIGFAIVYMWYYHLGSGLTQEEEYIASVKKAEIELAAYRANAAESYDENTVVLSTEATVLGAGKNTFEKFCATCHRSDGGGETGPNLTDDYWIHGGKINDLFRTVNNGVPGKGMAAWGEQNGVPGLLTAKQIFEVTNYIKSLRGTNPPNPKDKQGNLYVEGDAAADTLAVPLDTLNTDTLKLAEIK
jgi:cytochrome c oxidase cbb3-type subunit III